MSDFIGTKIALVHGGQLLMILRDDKPGLRFPGLWDFPGGGRDNSETPEECAVREVFEELNIKLPLSRIIYQKKHSAMHDPTIDAYFMVAEISNHDIENIVFGNEGQKWQMFGIDEFFNSHEVVEPLKARLQDYIDSKPTIL